MKEEDVRFRKAEETVLAKEFARRGVIRVRRHDVPRHRFAKGFAVVQQLLGEDLKERLVANGSNGIFALRSIVTEAMSRKLPLTQRMLASRPVSPL